MVSFRIYELKFDEHPDSLTNAMLDSIEYIEPNSDETRRILKRADKIIYKSFIWKGKILAVATFSNGMRRRILINNYGEFFLDMEDNCFYQFKGEARKDWDEFIQRSLGNCTIIEQSL